MLNADSQDRYRLTGSHHLPHFNLTLCDHALGRPKDMAKRQSILDEAKHLFLSKGFASTSMDAMPH